MLEKKIVVHKFIAVPKTCIKRQIYPNYEMRYETGCLKICTIKHISVKIALYFKVELHIFYICNGKYQIYQPHVDYIDPIIR